VSKRLAPRPVAKMSDQYPVAAATLHCAFAQKPSVAAATLKGAEKLHCRILSKKISTP